MQARAKDDGGSTQSGALPIILYRFHVGRSNSAAALPATITLAWIDTDTVKIDADAALRLAQGRDYVMFLEKLTEKSVAVSRAMAPSTFQSAAMLESSRSSADKRLRLIRNSSPLRRADLPKRG